MGFSRDHSTIKFYCGCRIYRWLHGGELIHILLVTGTVVVVIRVIQGRRPLQRFGLVNLLRKEISSYETDHAYWYCFNSPRGSGSCLPGH